jgi:hypothetical protein
VYLSAHDSGSQAKLETPQIMDSAGGVLLPFAVSYFSCPELQTERKKGPRRLEAIANLGMLGGS